MPLTKCPDCGTEVSDAAPSCLKCGRPMLVPGASRAKASLGGALLGFGVGWMLCWGSCGNFSPNLRGEHFVVFGGVGALFAIVGAIVGAMINPSREPLPPARSPG